MYSFFVLGLIPGTNIQISFQMWLDTLLAVTIFIGLVMVALRHRRTDFAVYVGADKPARTHVGMDASQLHLRAV